MKTGKLCKGIFKEKFDWKIFSLSRDLFILIFQGHCNCAYLYKKGRFLMTAILVALNKRNQLFEKFQ